MPHQGLDGASFVLLLSCFAIVAALRLAVF